MRLAPILNRLLNCFFRRKACCASFAFFEALETRQLLSAWTPLTNPIPDLQGANTMLLLPNGSVMVHITPLVEYNSAPMASAGWYELTPVNGNYIDGTWSQLSSMNESRLYFGSAVLPNGNVFVVGGEYSGEDTAQNWTNTAEMYDSSMNSWMALPDYPEQSFGDDPIEVLPGGSVLGGYVGGAQTFVFKPSSDSRIQDGSKLKRDRSDEESWVKMADGSILSYDIFASRASGSGSAQRFIPSTGKWVRAGSFPFLLSRRSDRDEMGAGVLLPDGRAFFLGGDGRTAFYSLPKHSSGPGTWKAGPKIPDGLVAADAPAAVLPNGDVLVSAAPPLLRQKVDGSYFQSPTSLFEFNPISGKYTNVTQSGNRFFNVKSSFMTMLVLPTGQVLMANDTDQLEVYTPNGAPHAAWRPAIATVEKNTDGAYSLFGMQLNGLSEGAAYGDDAQMAENYPIVELVDASGNVIFGDTYDWSSTGVATGDLLEVTRFSLPSTVPSGTYQLSVVADGIASPSITFLVQA